MASILERPGPDGKPTYLVRVRKKGHSLQSSTFHRLTDAKKWARDTESAIDQGRHFKTTEAKRRTVGDVIDRYIAEVLPRKKQSSRHSQRPMLDWWKDRIGHMTLADLSAAAIVAERDNLAATPTYREKPRSAANVNHHLRAFRHALSVAFREWEWLDDNPMRRVQNLKEPRGRVRFLDDDERNALLKACAEVDHDLHDFVMLLLLTGARYGELSALQWPHVDLPRRHVVFVDTKNGERRRVPLAGPAVEIVERRSSIRRIDNAHVFPGVQPQSPADFIRRWYKAVEKSGLKDFRIHDCRHSCASYLAQNGASLAVIAEILGHKTLSMVKRYSHLTEAVTGRDLERMATAVFAVESKADIG